MIKYRWSTNKTLEYLATKKPDLEITTEILAGFQILEKELKMDQLDIHPKSQSPMKTRQNWEISDLQKVKVLDSSVVYKEDEAALINAHKNSLKAKNPEISDK